MNKINSIISNFFWGSSSDHKKMHLISWDNITVLKANSGLGIHNIYLQSLSLNVKRVAAYLNNRDNLWLHLVKHKYPKLSIANAEPPPSYSWSWRLFVKAFNKLSIGFQSIIRFGNNTSLMHDPWLLDLPFNRKATFINIHLINDALKGFLLGRSRSPSRRSIEWVSSADVGNVLSSLRCGSISDELGVNGRNRRNRANGSSNKVRISLDEVEEVFEADRVEELKEEMELVGVSITENLKELHINENPDEMGVSSPVIQNSGNLEENLATTNSVIKNLELKDCDSGLSSEELSSLAGLYKKANEIRSQICQKWSSLAKVISSGTNTKIFDDPWCFDIPIAYNPTYVNISMFELDLCVADLMDNNNWDLDMLNNLFDSDLPLSVFGINLGFNRD
ncbi:ribonuclease H protein [Canna indica]|uniref:Ribonuclease H protein n=1 Tax=Canna indica TaxID=4628 RepID=A0AAQ3KS81_9LILI|nr:ribonuclease H protein [Canna indica]